MIGGKVRIKLEAGIQSGKTLRLHGKGIQELNGYGKGDVISMLMYGHQNNNREQERFFKDKLLEDANFAPKPSKSDSHFRKVKDMFAEWDIYKKKYYF